ncbi:MAG: sorbosone dehydrogenase family protein, partial [Halobacteriales archaeon]
TAGGEKGLLGIALHPDFAANRRLFLRYSAPRRPGTPENYSHTFVLSEFAATADGRRIRRESERPLLEIPEPQANHNAGDLAFGPDGHLFVPVGDGGAAGDQGPGHADDWYDAVPGGNGQDVTENRLGSVLRIDVDESTGDRGYGVPDDNPLVGRPGYDELYAWGLRNPWRLSFDGEDGYVADVGQNRYEEVDRLEKGGNYGWNVKEGTHCYAAGSCPDRTPEAVRGGEPLLDPVIEYAHGGSPVGGVSVIGGHVYRGDALPGLAGTYVFGDLAANGRLFAATPRDTDGQWPVRVLEVADADADKLGRLYSFGRDADGEVYALGSGQDGGGVHRLVPAG